MLIFQQPPLAVLRVHRGGVYAAEGLEFGI